MPMTDETDGGPQERPESANDDASIDVETTDEQRPWQEDKADYETREDFLYAVYDNLERLTDDLEGETDYRPVAVGAVVVGFDGDGDLAGNAFSMIDPTVSMNWALDVARGFNTELARVAFDVGIRDAIHNESNNDPLEGLFG